MKSLLVVLLLTFSSWAAANNSFGCGLGMHHQGVNEPLEFRNSSLFSSQYNMLGTVSCWHQKQPELRAHGWFLGSPNLYWQNSISTQHELNPDKHQLHHRHLALEWSFLRFHEAFIGISALHQENELNAVLERDVFTHNTVNILMAGETYFIQQKRQQFGLWLDLQLMEGLITDIHLSNNRYRQPMLITTEAQEDEEQLNFLSEGKLQSWQLAISRRPQQLGWQWQWQLALERGHIDHSSFPTTGQLSNTDFIGIVTQLGWHWRYRINEQLHFSWEAGNRIHYLLFSGNPKTGLAAAWQQQLDYHSNLGLSWQF